MPVDLEVKESRAKISINGMEKNSIGAEKNVNQIENASVSTLTRIKVVAGSFSRTLLMGKRRKR